MKKNSHSSETDLFNESIKGATPLKNNRIHNTNPKPYPIPKQTISDNRLVLNESIKKNTEFDIFFESGEETYFLQNGISQKILKKLKAGFWKVEREIDLHGFNQSDAKDVLKEFMFLVIKKNLKCIRIIHGKGLGSRNKEPVLKKMVANYLALKSEVLAFCEAKPYDGGRGATLVLLKNKKKLFKDF